MNKELKKAILNWIIENENEFQITNACTDHFRQNIYTDTGSFCIGGEQVYMFVKDAVSLLRK